MPYTSAAELELQARGRGEVPERRTFANDAEREWWLVETCHKHEIDLENMAARLDRYVATQTRQGQLIKENKDSAAANRRLIEADSLQRKADHQELKNLLGPRSAEFKEEISLKTQNEELKIQLQIAREPWYKQAAQSKWVVGGGIVAVLLTIKESFWAIQWLITHFYKP